MAEADRTKTLPRDQDLNQAAPFPNAQLHYQPCFTDNKGGAHPGAHPQTPTDTNNHAKPLPGQPALSAVEGASPIYFETFFAM